MKQNGMAYWCAILVSIVVFETRLATGAPSTLLPGYSLTKISNGVATSNIAQLAFSPGDNTHLFAARTLGKVTRYDYDPVTGKLSNLRHVARVGDGGDPIGLAFHDNDLYVSIDLGGSISERPGDGRISRFSNPNVNGVYRIRHDFVHSIPKGNHDVNQLQIIGNTLYVGIGAVGNTGDPGEENIYTMTIGRIADLTKIDFGGPIGADFKGPINYLAGPQQWINRTPLDGYLRYYASGFRNPFGILVDPNGGGLWVSSNGHNDPAFLSPDPLYKNVPAGGQGDFPPAYFGFSDPHITGTPIAPFVDLGQSPSPTGMAFVPRGPHAGQIAIANFGAANDVDVGRNVLLVDPNTGATQVLVTGLLGPTDVVQDPFGRLLIADFFDRSIWLLTPPEGSAGGPAVLDAFIQNVPPNSNEGGNPRLAIGWRGDQQRTLVAFDPTEIADAIASGLSQATLVLSIAENGQAWGSTGRMVDAHPLLQEFAEGVASKWRVPTGDRVFGEGQGVTWRCAIDENIPNNRRDCSRVWNGGRYAPPSAPSARHTNTLEGEVAWDVTDDVLAGYDAWLIRKADEASGGRVTYFSKEGAIAAGDPDLRPRLILR